jgi:hypothetical protein
MAVRTHLVELVDDRIEVLAAPEKGEVGVGADHPVRLPPASQPMSWHADQASVAPKRGRAIVWEDI